MKRHFLIDVVDAVIVSLAACVAYALRTGSLYPTREVFLYSFFSLAASLVVFGASSLNKHVIRFYSLRDVMHLGVGMALAIAVSSLVAFLIFRLQEIPRTLPPLQWFLALAMASTLRIAWRLWHGLRAQERPLGQREPLLVIGNTPQADIFLRIVALLGRDRYQVVGILEEDRNLHGSRIQGCEIIGHPRDLSGILLRLKVHGVPVRNVLLAQDRASLSSASRNVLQRLEREGIIEVTDIADKLRRVFPPDGAGRTKTAAEHLQQCPIPIAVRQEMEQRLRRYGPAKRGLDICGALVLGIIALPIGLVVAGLVWLFMGRPVLFWQERFGQGGRFIRVYKFRTLPMPDVARQAPDADAATPALGRFLRATRLDELPQLYNILKGDMSFVGPRPLLPMDLPLDMPGCVRLRSSVRPGLTGWAQINGGQQVSKRDKIMLDLWYLQHMSFRLDVLIVFKTLLTLLRIEDVNDDNIRRAYEDLQIRLTDIPQTLRNRTPP